MNRSFLFLLLIISNTVLSQTKISQSNFNLGKISKLNEDVIDLVLGNYGSEDLYLLKIVAEAPITTKYTSKSIPANSSSILRIKLNPREKGKIKRKVLLYFSDSKKPTEITLSANVKTTPRNRRQECPSFNREDIVRKKARIAQYSQATKIKRYQVQVGTITKGNEQLARQTNTNSTRQQERIPSIEDQRRNYGRKQRTSEAKAASNKKTQRKEQRKQTPEERRNSPSLLEKLFGDPATEANENEPKEQETTIAQKATQKSKSKNKTPKEEQGTTLLTDNYRPNNIIFLIDASNSMTKVGRMDLLKITMTTLLDPLRSIDSLAIVTYSGDASVLIAPTSGIEKDTIAATINNITAAGSTQAAKGLSTAIDVGLKSFIPEGNNQIILATDGDFNIGKANDRLREKIASAAQKGLSTSVVGIKRERGSRSALKEIKNLGKGEMLQVKKETQTNRVLEMIKARSIEH